MFDTTLRFGSQLFVNPEDTAETMRTCVAVLDQAGFKLIRLFLAWGQLEREPGQFNWSPFQEIFDEAHSRRMKIVGTLFSTSPPGWMKLGRGTDGAVDLDEPILAASSAEHVRAAVERFRDHPALDSWILWNEPSRFIPTDSPHALKNFRKFIAMRHAGDVAAYNAAQDVPIDSFDQALPGNVGVGQIAFVSHRQKVEWINFAVHDLQEKLGALAGTVRVLDPAHPIHVNPHRVSQCVAPMGQSIWQETTSVDFIGCSAHPAWHSVRFPRSRYGASVALFADLMRSATRAKDQYFWVTELQGGTTLLSGFEPLAPEPEEARCWLWECIGSGAKAVIYWCAHARTDGYEAGEWDLLDFQNRPTRRLELIGDTIAKIKPSLATLSKVKPPVPDVGILISEASCVLDFVEGIGEDPTNARNQQRGTDAIAGAYLMGADLSLEMSFHELNTLRDLSVDALPPILIAPSLTVVDEAMIAYLGKAVRGGRILIGDGFFAWKNQFGRLAQELYPLADRLWGAECVTYEAIDNDVSFRTAGDRSQRGWFVRPMLQPTTADPTGFWPDGVAAMTRHAIVKGTACRIGTALFQRYFVDADAQSLVLFQQLIADHLFPRVRLENAGAALRLRRLRGEASEIGVLINSSDDSPNARLVAPSGRVASLPVPPRDAILVDLDTLSLLPLDH